MKGLRLLLPYLRGSRQRLAASSAVALAQAALLIAVGLLVRRAFDNAIPHDHVRTLVLIGVALLAVGIASAALALVTRALVLRAVKDAVNRLRIALLDRLSTLPQSWFDRADGGTVHATIVQDTERLDVIGNALAAGVIPAVVIGAGLSVALLVINPLLFGILALTLPASTLFTKGFRGLVRRRTRDWQLAFDRFSTRVLFAVRARPLITGQAAEEIELDDGSADVVALGEAGRVMAWTQSAYGQLHGVAGLLAGVIVLVVGGASVARGSMSLGALVSFYALLAMLRAQSSAVLGAVPQFISGGESLARLEVILNAPETQPYSGSRAHVLLGALALRDVDFGYAEDSPVLQGMSLELERGRWLTLVGPNGSGKTTIAALLLGLYRPWRGTVEADGVPYDALDLRALRRQIGFVPQRPILFSGSIAENIAYGTRDADPGRIRDAARLAMVDEFAEGLDASVGDDGGLFSGGERQRIAIARALLREPAVLILDEPTSSLDRHAMALIVENLRTLPNEPSVLVITHDPTLVDDADLVVDLRARAV